MKSDLVNETLGKVRKKNISGVHFQFVDIPGNLKSVHVPTKTRTNKKDFSNYLENGIGFDGSSIEGFVRIAEGDLVLKPYLETFKIFPWKTNNAKEGRLVCEVLRPGGFPLKENPIYALRKAEERLEKKLGRGVTYQVGPEIEFFLFEMNESITAKPLKTDLYGYFDYTPLGKTTAALNRAVNYMQDLGVVVYKDHHEVSKGQYEINFKHGSAFETALNFVNYKLAVKTASAENGLYASFMPKPILGANGSGSHVHQSLFNKDGENLFFDSGDKYHLSQTAKQFLEGQLRCVSEIVGVTNPTVNSYKRLVPGFEAPVYKCWGSRNRSALIRKPEYFPKKEKETRFEARWPDPSMNPFLGFTVMLEAGLHGIDEKMELRLPVEEDVYNFDDAKLKKFYIETLPGSLEEAMQLFDKSKIAEKALGRLLKEKVLDVLRSQWDEYRIQVHPWEVDKYLKL